MSAEELSRLSLGDIMVTTRRRAAAEAAARAENSPLQASDPPSETSSPTPTIIESASGLKYDLSSFDEQVRKRAARGLAKGDNAIRMKYCRELGGDPNQYMFYIYDDISITMGGGHPVPKCSCGANEGGIACKHIFWILDQLTTGAPSRVRSQTLQLAMDGSAVQDIQPAHMVNQMTLPRVADGLDWVLQDGVEYDDDEIEDQIAEMLSVFEPSDALPSEFKSSRDFSFLSERARKYAELKELLTQYATEDLGLLVQLQAVIDPAFQVHVFFDKINNRIASAFNALDDYIANGPTDTLTRKSYDVAKCAESLKAIVQAVHEYYQQQFGNDSDTSNLAIRAASALISILDGVTNRDFDAYANTTWGGIPPADPTENNLFVCLIGAPPVGNGLFVLDALLDLPHDDVLRNHWELLTRIGSRLEMQRTPAAFLSAFNSVVSESKKRAAPEAEGSSAKRPMQ
ncbi:hypothetical protein CC78DRAFT_182131 [Lojkania enalia]|uniref:SWIM-type domain-containing protein n=1 Tax=Lojkania enalia TaxID=147567 RepID=A0A9P4KAB7_9PLEO|nr:hypothetical protein CC78DRAFT_182131 [Didymosphaeria enalia]